MDYTGYAQGPIIFFLISAILSVPLAAASLTMVLRGIFFTKKQKYYTLLKVIAIFHLFFLPAVIMYRWLDGSSAYDVLYHIVGYVGSLILYSIALRMASSDAAATASGALFPIVIAVIYLVFATFVAESLGMQSPEVTFSSNTYSPTSLNYILGAGYASIQIIYPLVAYSWLKSNGTKERERRDKRIAARNMRRPASNTQPAPSVVPEGPATAQAPAPTQAQAPTPTAIAMPVYTPIPTTAPENSAPQVPTAPAPTTAPVTDSHEPTTDRR